MCGLVGVAGDLSFSDEALMKRLLLMDYLRGPDSTGLAAIRSNGDVNISKLPSHPLDLFEMPKFKMALNANQSRVFIGHNRAATRGGVTTFNAHPYQYGHIVGAHNGTLDWAAVTELEKQLDEKFPVDSMALVAAIAKFGIKDAMSMASGAWSLVWYDLERKSINFLRNKERPMWFAYNEKFDRLFWASEHPFIKAATDIGNYPHKLYREEATGFSFWATEENVHYEFDIEALRKGSKERPKPKAQSIVGRETVKVRAPNTHDPFNRSSNVSGIGSSDESLKTTVRSTSSGSSTTGRTTTTSPSKVVHILGGMSNPLGGFITKAAFDDMAKFGCGYCNADVEWGDVGITVIERDQLVLCADCSTTHPDEDPNTRIYSTAVNKILN